MNSAWEKLWPEYVPDQDLDIYKANSGIARHSQEIFWDDSTIIDDIVTIGQSMRLEVDDDDIVKILEDHSIELTTEELEHLQNEKEKKSADKIEEKEEDKGYQSSALIK